MSARGSCVGLGTHKLFRNTQLIKQQAIKNKDELNKTKEVVNSNSDDIHQNKINIKNNTDSLNNIGNILLQSMLNFSVIGEKTIDTSKCVMEFHMIDTFPVNLDYDELAFKPLRTADYYLTGTINCKSAAEGLKGIEFELWDIRESRKAYSIKHHWEHNEEVQIPLNSVLRLVGSPTKQYQYQFKCKSKNGTITMNQASINLFKINGIMA